MKLKAPVWALKNYKFEKEKTVENLLLSNRRNDSVITQYKKKGGSEKLKTRRQKYIDRYYNKM